MRHRSFSFLVISSVLLLAAAAAARYIGNVPSATAIQTYAALIINSSPQNGDCGFTGDPDYLDSSHEPVLSVRDW